MCASRDAARGHTTMSMRRGARAPPAATRPGTLCGPAITFANTGSYVGAVPLQTTSKLPHTGTIVKVDNENYAVKCDLTDRLWWYPNVHAVGAKLYVKARPNKVVEITINKYDYVLKSGYDVSMDVPISEYQVGTRVQFTPYERSELKFENHFVVLIDAPEWPGVETYIAMPHDVAGVATQVLLLRAPLDAD